MQTTSTTWKNLWAAGNARLETRAKIAGTAYTEMSNPVITRALTQQGLSVGNAVSATCQFSVLTSATIPRAATVVIEQRLTDGTTTSEWLPAGTFYIAHRTRDAVTGLLSLECYDALLKANAPMPSGTWPQSMANVTSALATALGVTLDSRTTIKTGANYVINEPDPGTTIHDVLCRIAGANGGNWVITPAGKLRLVPVVSAAGAASATTDVIDVAGVLGEVTVHASNTITGVRYQADDAPMLIGSDTGLVLDVDLGAFFANAVYDDLHGMTYQAYDLAGAIYDPAAELGDYVRGGANGEVSSVLYSETATLGLAFRGDISAPQPDELYDEYPYIGGNQKVLTAAKVYAAQQVEALDDALTQQEVFNRLTGNGAAQGLYIVDGQLYVNASYIQSGTLRLGGLNNVNGLFELLDADGNVAIRGSNTGFSVGTGEIFSTLAGLYRDLISRLGDGRFDLMSGNTYHAYLGFTDYATDPVVQFDCTRSGGGLDIQGPDFQHQGATNHPFISLEPNGLITLRYHSLHLLPYYSDSSLYLSDPLTLSNGGLGADASTAAGKATARTNLGLDYAIYNSVTDLGLTSGSATILAAFNAMGTNTILICPAGEFASGEVPNTYGTVEIVKPSNAARSYVRFYGKDSSYHDWRMFIAATTYNGNDANKPTGYWQPEFTSFVGGRGADGAAARGTSLSITFLKSTVHFLMVGNSSTSRAYVGLVSINGSGGVSTIDLYKGSNVTLSNASYTLTLGFNSTDDCSFVCIPVRGECYTGFSVT